MAKKKFPIPEVIAFPTDTTRKLYFDNNKVEDQLVKYLWTSCTDVAMRDAIMINAEELIRQIIRAHGLHKIYPGYEESAFGDLFQTAWLQIERTLYKYKAKPHCAACYNLRRPQDSVLYEPAQTEYGILTPAQVAQMQLKCPACNKIPSKIMYRGTSKVFNLWSQIARTRILAYIKKESRDYKNSDSYKAHLNNKYRVSHPSGITDRFIVEAKEVFKYNETYLIIVEALSKIIQTDDRPYEGIITKLVNETELPRSKIAAFLKIIKMRSDEFTDSPLNDKPKPRDAQKDAQFEED